MRKLNSFSKMFNNAMKKKEYSVRGLEKAIVEIYGSDKKISRGLIGDYKTGKRAPTYESAIILADVLEIQREEFLEATFRLKKRARDEAELERFRNFCSKHAIDI